jgi:hypothetical protein
MSLSLSSLPPGFSWLRPAYRPSPQEVDAYAHLIADTEGILSETDASRLYEEAELQLWIWRHETRQRPVRSRASRDESAFAI